MPSESFFAFAPEGRASRLERSTSAAASSSAEDNRNWSELQFRIRARMLTHTVVPRWSSTATSPIHPVGTRREYLSPSLVALESWTNPDVSGLFSKSNPGSTVSFQSQSSCPHAQAVSISLFPTDHVLKTRILVLHPDPAPSSQIFTQPLCPSHRPF